MSKLNDRVIVVTGASSGIGRATSLACAEAGMDLLISARREGRLNEVRREIESLGRRAAVVPADVTDPDASARLLDAAEAEFGRFDVVFANAGFAYEMPTIEMTDAQLRRIFEVNFFAAIDLVHNAGRRLIERRQAGHLLMCSSCLAKFTMPYFAAYSATKAAQNHLCRALRLELEPHDIMVSSVHPVTTRTELFDVMSRESGDGVPGTVPLPEHTPSMFVQPPERVAKAVVKCLKRPKPEVWTSITVRFAAALFTWSPRLFDFVMRKEVKRASAKREQSTERPPRDTSPTVSRAPE